MKLQTLGKIQIWVGLTLFLVLLIINIIVYFAMQNVVGVSFQIQQIQPSSIPQFRTDTLLVGFVLFTEILIASDIIILILISMLVIDGAAMLSKD